MKNTLPKFLFCENKSVPLGAGLILCTEVPFYIAQVIKDVSIEGITSLAKKNKGIAMAKPYNYRIGIIITGALHSSLVINDGAEYAQQMATLAREMSDFYLEEKIKHNLKYYERFKESG